MTVDTVNIVYTTDPNASWLAAHTSVRLLNELRAGDRFVLYGPTFERMDWRVYEVADGHVYPQGCAVDADHQLGVVYLKNDMPLLFGDHAWRRVRVLNPDVNPDKFLAQYVLRLTERLTPTARALLTQYLYTAQPGDPT